MPGASILIGAAAVGSSGVQRQSRKWIGYLPTRHGPRFRQRVPIGLRRMQQPPIWGLKLLLWGKDQTPQLGKPDPSLSGTLSLKGAGNVDLSIRTVPHKLYLNKPQTRLELWLPRMKLIRKTSSLPIWLGSKMRRRLRSSTLPHGTLL
jgi:hypothetical protein